MGSQLIKNSHHRLLRGGLIGLLLLAICSCASLSSYQSTQYKVRKGDTLYSIAWRYETTYKKIARLNRIKKPYKIKAGETLKIRYAKSSNLPKPKPRKARPKNTSKGKTTVKPAKTVARKAVSSSNKISKWNWPIRGPIVKTFGSNRGLTKGIEIANKQFSKVVASAPGVIVYAGDGLRSYGNLIIIKHNDEYLSAYGYLQKINVKEGQKVKQGQLIATLGLDRAQKALLHFEIRRDGRPVDPIGYLPAR